MTMLLSRRRFPKSTTIFFVFFSSFPLEWLFPRSRRSDCKSNFFASFFGVFFPPRKTSTTIHHHHRQTVTRTLFLREAFPNALVRPRSRPKRRHFFSTNVRMAPFGCVSKARAKLKDAKRILKQSARARFTTFASSIHAQRLSHERITNPKKRKLFCLDSGLIVLFVRSQNRALCSIKLCVKKVSSKVVFF